MSLTNSFCSALGFCVALTAVSNTGLAQEFSETCPRGSFRVGLRVGVRRP